MLAFVPPAVALAVSQVIPVFAPRYIGFVLPVVVVVAAVGVLRLARLPRLAVVSGFAVASIVGLAGWYGSETESWRSVLPYLASAGSPTDAIFVYQPGGVFAYRQAQRDTGVIPGGVLIYPTPAWHFWEGRRDVDSREVAPVVAQRRRLFLVMRHYRTLTNWRHMLETAFRPYYTLTSVRDFTNVSVAVYERRHDPLPVPQVVRSGL